MSSGPPKRGFDDLSDAAKNELAGADDLVVELYAELRRLAAARLARSPGAGGPQTLQPTALVHEAFLRLLGKEAEYENHRHFFFAAARAMQDILIEQARRKSRRAGRADLAGDRIADDAPEIDSPANVIELGKALERLQEADSRKADLVRLRFFAGLTLAQAAEVMGVSVPTLEREWRLARSILHVQLKRAGSDG